ncbi:MAG: hypothetical protein NDI67_01920 [Sulfuritalea sp.]|nr:hypothetical protein [Sulfuritalea sp.]
MKRSSLFALSALTLAFAPAAWADTVSSITPSASRVMLNNGQAMVRFTVAGQGNEGSDCGLWIEYGDNGSPDTRIVGREQGLLPRAFDHTFSAPGQYTVTAKGQRVKQTFGCSGSATTLVTVLAEERQSRRESRREAAAEACPDGWMLREGSYSRQTGAFSCTPAYPAQQLDCGPGLRYFEADNQIGCRPTGRARGRD